MNRVRTAEVVVGVGTPFKSVRNGRASEIETERVFERKRKERKSFAIFFVCDSKRRRRAELNFRGSNSKRISSTSAQRPVVVVNVVARFPRRVPRGRIDRDLRVRERYVTLFVLPTHHSNLFIEFTKDILKQIILISFIAVVALISHTALKALIALIDLIAPGACPKTNPDETKRLNKLSLRKRLS